MSASGKTTVYTVAERYWLSTSCLTRDKKKKIKNNKNKKNYSSCVDLVCRVFYSDHLD